MNRLVPFFLAAASGILTLAHTLPATSPATAQNPDPAQASRVATRDSVSDTHARTSPPLFRDRSGEFGFDFVHFNGMTGRYYFPEMTGQGGALVDYDNDGDLDIYAAQGTMLGPEETLADAIYPLQGTPPPRDRLFRNDLTPDPEGRAIPHFVDVTDSSGLQAYGYGMGVAAADYDNDGWIDIYVTNYGPNQMWRNNGDGTFSDTTTKTGTGDDLWGTSASFFDFDRDGWLDLYVANYVVFDVARNPRCFASSSRQDYCGPSDFPPQPDRLYRNRGDGTFQEVSVHAFQMPEIGPGLGVVATDFDGDSWADIYVANDGRPNHLWINQKDGTFLDDGLLAGVAVNRLGQAEASMGVSVADFDGDGDEDLFTTHLMGETNTLFVNDGTALFEDRTIESGLASGSLPFTSFGTGWFDLDNDGWLDLLILSGAVKILEPLAEQGDPYPLHQPNRLFRNLDGVRFEDATDVAGESFKLSETSRGAAFGDVDNDGDTDFVIFNSAAPARLLINETGQSRSWIGARVLARKTQNAVLGARVNVQLRSGRRIWRRIRTDGSYCSSSDSRVILGMASDAMETLRVEWPDDSEELWVDLPPGHYVTIQHDDQIAEDVRP